MLKPRKRLTKAQLKQDKFILFTAQAQAWLTQYQKYILYGFIGLIVIVVGVSAVAWSKSSSEKQASFEELLARDAYSRGDIDSALIRAEAIIEKYEGTSAAGAAWMLKGKIHEQRGEFEPAIKAFEHVASKYDDQEYLAFGALYAIGMIHYGEHEYVKAGEYFDNAVKRYPKHFHCPVALVKGGEAYERGLRYTDAKRLFQRVVTQYPKSRSADGARESLAKIEFMPQ